MRKSRQFFLMMMISINCLSACNTMKSQEAQKEEQKKKTVASINIQLGMAYLEDKDMQRAKEKLLLALEDAPNLPEAQYSMAYFYEAIGDPKQANTYYQKAMALAPHRGDTQNNYGTFLCREHHYKAAISHFDLALQDPAYLDTAGANENAGLCAQQIPNDRLAYHYFKRAVMQDSNRPTSLYNLAKLNVKMKQYKAAQASLNQYLTQAESSKQTASLQEKINKKS